MYMWQSGINVGSPVWRNSWTTYVCLEILVSLEIFSHFWGFTATDRPLLTRIHMSSSTPSSHYWYGFPLSLFPPGFPCKIFLGARPGYIWRNVWRTFGTRRNHLILLFLYLKKDRVRHVGFFISSDSSLSSFTHCAIIFLLNFSFPLYSVLAHIICQYTSLADIHDC